MTCTDKLKLYFHRYGVLDWLVLIILIIIAAILNDTEPHHQRLIFPETNPDINFPYFENATVSSLSLWVISIVVPIVSLFILFALRWRQRGAWTEIRHALYAFIFNMTFTVLCTNAIKVFVGSPRPNFIQYSGYINGVTTASSHRVRESWMSFLSGHASMSFSGLFFLSLYFKYNLLRPIIVPEHIMKFNRQTNNQPSSSSSTTSSTSTTATNSALCVCTQSTLLQCQQTNYLFMSPSHAADPLTNSGSIHTSSPSSSTFVDIRSFARLLYLSEYGLWENSLWLWILCYAPLFLAGWCALTRITDYYHRTIDVVAGTVLGSTIAFWTFHVLYLQRRFMWIINAEREKREEDEKTAQNVPLQEQYTTANIGATTAPSQPQQPVAVRFHSVDDSDEKV